MIDSRNEIERRLSVLHGLQLSTVNHAADMLTLGFGSLRQTTNFWGVAKWVGEWALHIQCAWRLEQDARVVATQNDLVGSDEKAHASADRIRELIVTRGPSVVEQISTNDDAGLVISLSRGFRLVVVPDGVEDTEDWRFFAPDVAGAHLVIQAGAVAPESFD